MRTKLFFGLIILLSLWTILGLAIFNASILLIILGSVLLLILLSIKPVYGFYLSVLTLPIINWGINTPNIQASLAEICGLLALAAFILNYIFRYFKNKAKFSELKFPLAKVFAIFILVLLISAIFSPYSGYAIYYIGRWILFLYFVYIFLPLNLIKDGVILKKSIICFYLATIFTMVLGVVSLASQNISNSFFRIQPSQFFGVWPLGYNHNLIAEFLVAGAFIVLSLKHFYQNLFVKRVIDILFAITIIICIGTFSRTAWLVLAFQGLLYIYLQLKVAGKTLPWKKIIAVGLLLIAMIIPFSIRMAQLQSQNASSTENRVILTQIAWRAFMSSPLIGKGTGLFIYYVDQNTRFRAKYGDPLDSHGILQKVLAENGMLGIAALALIFFVISQQLYQGILRYKQEAQILIPLSVAAFGAILYQFFNTSYYKGKAWLPVTLALAALYLLQQKYAKRN